MYNNYPFNSYNYPQYFNQPQQANYGEIPKVTGFEGAKAYQLGPNQAVALFDANDSLFYLKTTDSAGFASYKTFHYVEQDNTAPTSNGISRPTSDGISREEFDNLKAEVERLLNANGEQK